MRLFALLLLRGGPVLGFVLLLVFLFDVGGAQEPITDAYMAVATRISEYFGEQLKDAILPSPTPSPNVRPAQ